MPNRYFNGIAEPQKWIIQFWGVTKLNLKKIQHL